MKLLILAVFCFVVNSNEDQSTNNAGFRPGLANLCKKFPTEENAKCCSENIERDPYCTKIGSCLIDNEEEVNNKKNLVYPCVDNDIECVRQFFAKNCLCQPRQGPVKDPLCIKQYRLFLPLANVTIILADLKIEGLSDLLIHSFHMNKKTGYLVLTIKVPFLTLSTPKICYEYHRLGKESIVRCDFGSVTYKSCIFTAELPGLPECRLDLGRIHGYILDSKSKANFGPNIYESTDPTVQEASAAIPKNVPAVIKENLVLRSEVIMTKYIESNICDFDIKMCYV